MRVHSRHPNFVTPTPSTDVVGAFDIYMPESGGVTGHIAKRVPLGFSAEIPEGHVALVLPKTNPGTKLGVELNNTALVVGPNDHSEWAISIKTKTSGSLTWQEDDALFQFIVVPVLKVNLQDY